MKHRKEIIQVLKPQEFEQLWTAYLSGNYSDTIASCFDYCGTESYDNFWMINNKLMANARGELEPFKHIPFVIYQVSGFCMHMCMCVFVCVCVCVCAFVCVCVCV